MKNPKRPAAPFIGAALFFVTVAAVVSVAVVVFAAVSEKTENKGVIAAVMLSVILFLALLCMGIDYLRRRITVDRPVKDILEATDKIASGDFSVRLQPIHDYGRYNQFDYIMENLNKMAAELSKTEVLHTDFIANVSHELKTPLAIIQSYAAALQGGSLDGETRDKYAQTLVSASKRLTALVTNILKLNKLENQELTPEYERVRLDEMLARTVLQFEELIESKGLTLECDLNEVELVTSPNYLEIVWNNLLSNAVKFTEAGGKIGVSVTKGKGCAVVKISDTGCGISKETGAHIFDKFYQGETSHSGEGNGLGLALVKKVIDVIGGEISVESRPGAGSTFTVTVKEA